MNHEGVRRLWNANADAWKVFERAGHDLIRVRKPASIEPATAISRSAETRRLLEPDRTEIVPSCQGPG
jgi:hypothetical protein